MHLFFNMEMVNFVATEWAKTLQKSWRFANSNPTGCLDKLKDPTSLLKLWQSPGQKLN